MNNPVVKILKQGETDINSTDISKFVIHSNYPNVKIGFSGSANFTMLAGNPDGQYVVTHNLGYVPIAYGWLERSGKIWPCNSFTGITDVLSGGLPASVWAIAMADDTTFTIIAYNKFPVDGPADGNYTFTAHWKISVDEY